MSAPAGQALTQALALIRSPRGARPGPADRLPDGMLLLLRIVAGDQQALGLALQSSGESADAVREAAKFYIQQVMFAPGGHSYRVLGVEVGATDEKLREHHHWLVRWLHPDRNSDSWEVVYSERVNKAWQDLRSPDRRRRYDASEHEGVEISSDRMPAAAPLASTARFAEVPEPRRSLSWLPAAIFAGLGVSALLAISMYYALRWIDQRPEAAPTQQAAAPNSNMGGIAAPVPVLDRIDPSDGDMAAKAVPPVEAPAEPVPAEEAPRAVERATAALAPSRKERRAPVPPVPEIRQSAPAMSIPAVAASATLLPEPDTAVPSQAQAVPRAAPDRIDERVAQQLLGRFSQAYAAGDIEALRSMFAADARGPAGGLSAILANYSRLFRDSEQRSLGVRDVSWFTTNGTLTIIASYEAVTASGRSRRERRTQGDLRMDLRLVDRQWRIYRLQHDERGG